MFSECWLRKKHLTPCLQERKFDKIQIHYPRIYCSIPVPPLQHGEGRAVKDAFCFNFLVNWDRGFESRSWSGRMAGVFLCLYYFHAAGGIVDRSHVVGSYQMITSNVKKAAKRECLDCNGLQRLRDSYIEVKKFCVWTLSNLTAVSIVLSVGSLIVENFDSHIVSCLLDVTVPAGRTKISAVPSFERRVNKRDSTFSTLIWNL